MAEALGDDFGADAGLQGEGPVMVKLPLGRRSEATPVFDQARVIFSRLGAKLALEETDALLDELSSSSQV